MELIPFYSILGLSVITTFMFLIWRDKNKPAFNILLKAIASFSFLTLGLVCTFVNNNFNYGVMFILIGLASSVFGDMFLGYKEFKNEFEDASLYSGFGAFCVTQCMYLIGMILIYDFTIWAFLIGAVITLVILLSEKMMKLNFDKFRIIVSIYSILLMTVLGQGIMNFALIGYSLAGLLFMLGFIFFALSDLILSFIYFRKDSKDILTILNLLTYYVGQILIATAILFI